MAKKTIPNENHIEVKSLSNEYAKITYPDGIINTRLNKWFSEAVVEVKYVERYVAATPENKAKYLSS